MKLATTAAIAEDCARLSDVTLPLNGSVPPERWPAPELRALLFDDGEFELSDYGRSSRFVAGWWILPSAVLSVAFALAFALTV